MGRLVGDEETVPNAIVVELDDPAWPGGPVCENLLWEKEMDDGEYPVVGRTADALFIVTAKEHMSTVLTELKTAQNKIQSIKNRVFGIKSPTEDPGTIKDIQEILEEE